MTKEEALVSAFLWKDYYPLFRKRLGKTTDEALARKTTELIRNTIGTTDIHMTLIWEGDVNIKGAQHE